MFKHILLPTDGSRVARKAVKAGISLAKELGAKVTAYHALEAVNPYMYADGYILRPGVIKEFEARAREQGAKVLAKVQKAARDAGVRCETVITTPATPYQGIVAAAKRQKCDVILMASHGRGGIGSLLLGSVTQKVLAQSKIPVLVYR